MEDLLKAAQEMGIQAMLDRETKWRDEKIAELEAQLADEAMAPWRRAIANHWGDEVLKATTPNDAIRAAYFKGLTASVTDVERSASGMVAEMRRNEERLKKEWLSTAP